MRATLAILRYTVRQATPALALGTAALTAVLAACSDSPMAPSASPSAPAALAAHLGGPVHGTNVPSGIVSTAAVGDTTVTTFIVGTNTASNVTFPIGNGSKVQFTGAASAICDPLTSSYGPGTWDSPCSPAATSVTITARTWVERTTGKTRSAFAPALRFVPATQGTGTAVQVFLKDPTYTPRDAIWYCPDGASTCVNEGATDPTLATEYSSSNQWVYRIIKHFSGYTVLVN